MTKKSIPAYLLGLALAGASWAAQAQTDVNVSVGGIIKPGVYGRVEIGTRPPPPVIYPQPVIIVQPPVAVAQPGVVVVQPTPVYMHVPPGHAKKWSKHCHKYNACNQPVYFVKNEYEGRSQGRGRGRDHDEGDRGEGRGEGRGKHKKDD
jgi:hypothetical protein